MDLAGIRLASPYAANAVLLWATGEPSAPLPVFAPFLATRPIGEFGTEALSPNVDPSIAAGIEYLKAHGFAEYDESGRSCGLSVPLLQPTAALQKFVATITETDIGFVLEEIYYHIEQSWDRWLIQWYMSCYLRPHLIRFTGKLCSEVESVDTKLTISSRLLRFLAYVLRVALFAGENVVSARITNIIGPLATRVPDPQDAILANFVRAFCQAYYTRRMLDNADACREKIDIALNLCDDEANKNLFSFPERHQLAMEDLSTCFQQDDWPSAKKKLVAMEHALLNHIAPADGASHSENTPYTEAVHWESIIPLPSTQYYASAAADCLFARSIIDRAEGGFGLQTLRSSTRAVTFYIKFYGRDHPRVQLLMASHVALMAMSKQEDFEGCIKILDQSANILEHELGKYTDHLSSVYHALLNVFMLNPHRSEEFIEVMKKAIDILIGIRKRYCLESQSFLRMALFLISAGSALPKDAPMYERVQKVIRELYDGSLVDDTLAAGRAMFNAGAGGIGTLADAVIAKCTALLAEEKRESVKQAREILSQTLQQAEQYSGSKKRAMQCLYNLAGQSANADLAFQEAADYYKLELAMFQDEMVSSALQAHYHYAYNLREARKFNEANRELGKLEAKLLAARRLDRADAVVTEMLLNTRMNQAILYASLNMLPAAINAASALQDLLKEWVAFFDGRRAPMLPYMTTTASIFAAGEQIGRAEAVLLEAIDIVNTEMGGDPNQLQAFTGLLDTLRKRSEERQIPKTQPKPPQSSQSQPSSSGPRKRPRRGEDRRNASSTSSMLPFVVAAVGVVAVSAVAFLSFKLISTKRSNGGN